MKLDVAVDYACEECDSNWTMRLKGCSKMPTEDDCRAAKTRCLVCGGPSYFVDVREEAFGD